MADEPLSPQQLIDDAAKALGSTPVSDVVSTPSPLPPEPAPTPSLMQTVQETETTIKTTEPPSNTPEPEVLLKPQEDINLPPPPEPAPMIFPTKETVDQQEKPEQKKEDDPEKKKPTKKKGLLIAIILFFIFTLPIAIYYISQTPQLAEIRSKAYIFNKCVNIDPNDIDCHSVKCTATTKKACTEISNCCDWQSITVTDTPTPTEEPEDFSPTPTKTQCAKNGNTCYAKNDIGSNCIDGQLCAGEGTCGVNYICCKPCLALTPSVTNTPTLTPLPTPLTKCPNPIDAACVVGGSKYYAWLPNHAICGVCDPKTNKITGTWEGEPGVAASCCPSGCTVSGSLYPWTFSNVYCLSTKTSNREGSYVDAGACASIKPCTTALVPTGETGTTNTKAPTKTPTSTPIGTTTLTGTVAYTPTATIATTSAPGTCDASCDSDANCESGLSCLTTDGIKRCRNVDCPNEYDCSCSTSVATVTHTPVPTRAQFIAEAPVVEGTPTDQPTPKVPVSGVGPGILGALTVIGSIVLLLIGLIL